MVYQRDTDIMIIDDIDQLKKDINDVMYGKNELLRYLKKDVEYLATKLEEAEDRIKYLEGYITDTVGAIIP